HRGVGREQKMNAESRLEEGLRQIEAESEAALGRALDETSLRAVRAKLLGPRGGLTSLMKLLPDIPSEQRKELGQRVNELKQKLNASFEARLAAIRLGARESELRKAAIDTTLPGRGTVPGKLHPITRVIHQLEDIFVSMGFEIADGPEIEHYE